MFHIGKFYIGKRNSHTDCFKWFYHPMLRINEKQVYHFFVWFGWHLYICLYR